MEILYAIFLAALGAILLPLILVLTGVIGGLVTARVIQRAEPGISRRDVSAITRGWIKSFALGGVIAAVFFGFALAATFTWEYLYTGIYAAIGFAITGIFAGNLGARAMFRRIEAALNEHSQVQ